MCCWWGQRHAHPHARTFMQKIEGGHVRACIYALLLRVSVHALGKVCILHHKVSNGPHLQEICRDHRCHLEKREQRMRRGDETDFRGVLLCPQTLFFQAFLITLRGREQCSAQTLRTPSKSSTVSSFSAQKKERNQSLEERRAEGGMQ